MNLVVELTSSSVLANETSFDRIPVDRRLSFVFFLNLGLIRLLEIFGGFVVINPL